MIIGRTARLQLEFYPETGQGVMTCYLCHTEILDSKYAKCLGNEEFIVLEKCGVMFNVSNTP